MVVRKITTVSIFILFFLINNLKAQEEHYYYEDAVFNDDIKTVLMHRKGFEL